MKIRPRHMKTYKPRRRRSDKELQKQQLKDLEHLLSMDLSSLVILKEEGTPRQIEKARAKMRSHLMKYRSDMEAIGRDVGEGFPEIIREYIKIMLLISGQGEGLIDPALLNNYRKYALQIKKAA